MKNKRWYMFILGITALIQGMVIGVLFRNPYPCAASGIGCRSIWEALASNISVFYVMISLVIGVVLLGRSIMMIVRDEKLEKI